MMDGLIRSAFLPLTGPERLEITLIVSRAHVYHKTQSISAYYSRAGYIYQKYCLFFTFTAAENQIRISKFAIHMKSTLMNGGTKSNTHLAL